MADLVGQVQRLTTTMTDMAQRHQQEIQQRDVQMAEMKGAMVALQSSGSRTSPSRLELLDPKILHKVQPFDGQRASWRSFECQWRAYLIAQDRRYRELLTKIDDPTDDVANVDLNREEDE